MKNTETPLAQDQDSNRRSSVEHFDVFVSYNSKDRDDVRTICRQLESRGLKPWFDVDEIRPGDDWHDRVVAALEHVKIVVVVFGVAGSGPVQLDEIKFVYDQAKQRSLQIIPACLPDGEVPKNLVFSTLNVAKFQDGPKDVNALDRLNWAITGKKPKRNRGIFDIHVEVPQADRSCYMASSYQSDQKIYKVICSAASVAGATVRPSIEFDPNKPNIYWSEVMAGIRSAALVVADGALNPHTNKPDAEVMYEVGLAKALGKPIIVITPSHQAALPLPMFDFDRGDLRLEHDSDEVDADPQLLKRLTSMIGEVLNQQRPPFLVGGKVDEIGVAYADVFHMRVRFWPAFATIFRNGLDIKWAFAAVSQHIHGLRQIIDMAHADGTSTRGGEAAQRALDLFRNAYERFCQSHMEGIEIPAVGKNEDAAQAVGAFDVLLTHSTNDVHRLIGESRQNRELAESTMQGYRDAHGSLLAYIQQLDGPGHLLPKIIRLRAEIQCLADNADLVQVHIVAMMDQLLDIVAAESTHGGT